MLGILFVPTPQRPSFCGGETVLGFNSDNPNAFITYSRSMGVE